MDERGAPLPGLTVHAAGIETTSDDEGRFRIEAEGPIEVRDRIGARLLARGHPPEVVVARRVAEGWLATGRTGHPLRATEGNLVEPLVDDEQFTAVADLVRSATHRVDILELLFFPDFVASSGRPLADDLVQAATERGVRVRILLNENAVIPDTCIALERHAKEAGADGIEIRRFPMTPNVMHAKLVVVDGAAAIVVGSPMQQKYWDTTHHRAVEPRRASPIPLHDVAALVRGPAVADLHETFAQLWNLRQDPAHDDGSSARVHPRGPPAGRTTAQVLRTIPRDLPGPGAPGETTLREGYLRAIANARRFIYVETQYFTSETLIRALGKAVERTPGLQLILVLNEETDVYPYNTVQKRRVAELGHPGHPRIGVFTLWRSRPVDEAPVRSIYVHSKVAIVDDAWATIGSANLDSLGFEEGDEFPIPIDRNVELNIAMLDGVDGAPATGEVAAFRRRLWGEHLGDDGVWRPEPDGGWLAVWRERAEADLRAWRRGERMRGHALPYLPPELTPDARA